MKPSKNVIMEFHDGCVVLVFVEIQSKLSSLRQAETFLVGVRNRDPFVTSGGRKRSFEG